MLAEKVSKADAIKIKNDAKCAAIAENTYGSLKQYANSVFSYNGTCFKSIRGEST